MNLNQMAQDGEQEPSTAQPAKPEQQAQFDMLLGRARQLIGETPDEWLQTLKLDPVNGSVKMGTGMLRSLVQMSEKAGQPVDPAVLIHVGLTLIKDIAGIANEAGLVPDDQLESYIQEVTQLSIAEYLRMDADEGLLQGGGTQKEEAEPTLPGDPKTPDDTTQHESAESPAFEKREVASEPTEAGEDGMSEEDEMAMQLAQMRAKKGAVK